MRSVGYVLSLACLLALTWADAAWSNVEMTNIERFHGSSMEDVLKELGKTDMCESFLMEEAIGEFRVELHNIYPLNNPENRTVRISELSWQDGDYMITLWFHNVNDTWVVLDSRRWHKDTDF